tara:strand:+ start:390 stop:1922 length:1533 start_codon:yes stop_codon:yes gene_type:complete
MTAKIDFIGNIHGDWLEKNIRKDFGPSPDTAKLFIARVLEVVESEDPPDPRSISANDFNMYHIRCRILTLATHGQTDADVEFLNNKENPDALLPDPCNWTEPTANAHIQRHPIYYPNDNKLKKPHPGDLVKVTRNITQDPILGVAGHYVGFLTQTPPMELPKDPAGRGGFPRHRSNSKKTTPPGSTPPRQYKGQKLAEIARQAANAINNSLTEKKALDRAYKERRRRHDAGDPVIPIEDIRGLQEGKERAPGIGGGFKTSDVRLRNTEFEGMVSKKEGENVNFSTIPDSWYNASSEDFRMIAEFISVVSDGYPGMPSTPTRKYLIRNIKKLKIGPPIKQFAENSDYWKTWWFGGTRPREDAPIGGYYRSIITKTNYIPKTKNKIRFGFGSFTIEDIPLYFPTFKESKLDIKYAGAAGIGDPVCEMYAVMMFIRLNFGSPSQFASMNDEARKISNSGDDATNCRKKRHYHRNVAKRHPTSVGNYEIDHTIMPKNSRFSYGICGHYPPSEEM